MSTPKNASSRGKDKSVAKKRGPSPKEQEILKRQITKANRKLVDSDHNLQSPLLKFGFLNRHSTSANMSHLASGTTTQSPIQSPKFHIPPQNSLDMKVTCQEEMTGWVKNALGDPRCKSLFKAMKEEVFDREIEQINMNTSRVHLVEERCDRQQIEIESLRQNTKRNAIRITNPNWDDESANTTDLVVDFIKKDLKCTNFSPFFIDYSYRTGKKGSTDTILVMFTHASARDAILSYKKAVPHGCSINEELTPVYAFLAYCARQFKRSNDIKETWVKNGKIYVKSHNHDKAAIIQSVPDLLNQIQPPIHVPDFSWNIALSIYPEMDPMKYVALIRSEEYKQLLLDGVSAGLAQGLDTAPPPPHNSAALAPGRNKSSKKQHRQQSQASKTAPDDKNAPWNINISDIQSVYSTSSGFTFGLSRQGVNTTTTASTSQPIMTPSTAASAFPIPSIAPTEPSKPMFSTSFNPFGTAAPQNTSLTGNDPSALLNLASQLPPPPPPPFGITATLPSAQTAAAAAAPAPAVPKTTLKETGETPATPVTSDSLPPAQDDTQIALNTIIENCERTLHVIKSPGSVDMTSEADSDT